jgi:Asp-tRNA(Asn)/Glu-tRNA(Gln) amidotransferase A subunit family amidase
MDEVLTWGAVEALAAFRERTLSPVEYLDAILRRCDAVQPVVNAFGDTYFDEARGHARAAERRYRRGGDPPRPLEGLPVAVKDEADVGGKRTTNGSLTLTGYVAERSEPMVERLQDAGAIIHARSLTPELSIAFWTASRLWGVTRNPWNTAFDVGGSSGGSAAALAAGMTPLATGSDIGGSIRVPASCCGVVGYKPAYGRVPQPPPFGLDTWCHLGPLARTVADAALAADAMIGPDPRDIATLRPAIRIGSPGRDVRGMRIALSLDLGDWPVTEPVRDAVLAAAEALRAAGAQVEEVPLTIERALLRTASDAHCAAFFAAYAREAIRGREDDAAGYTLAWLRSLEDAPSPLDGLTAEGTITSRVSAVLADHEALLCPAMAVPAFEAGVDYGDRPVILAGTPFDAFHDICLTEVFNPAGRCPVLTVPAGRDGAGVPIGVQIVGRTYDDPTVFTIGAAVERSRPWPLVAEL